MLRNSSDAASMAIQPLTDAAPAARPSQRGHQRRVRRGGQQEQAPAAASSAG